MHTMGSSGETLDSADSIWKELPKPMTRLLRDELFTQKVDGKSIGESIVKMGAPLVTDNIEIRELIRDHSIEPKNYNEYVLSSPEFEAIHLQIFQLAADAAKNKEFPRTFAQLTKSISTLMMGNLMMPFSAAFRGGSLRRQSAMECIGNMLFNFIAAYGEAQYIRSALSQMHDHKDREMVIANTLRQTDSLLRGVSIGIRPHLKEIAHCIDFSKGTFAQTLDAVSHTDTSILAHEGDAKEILLDLQQKVLSGYVPRKTYSQVATSDGFLQYEILPVPLDKPIPMFCSLPEHIAYVRFNMVPQGHGGYYSPPWYEATEENKVGTYLFISGINGKLTIPGTQGHTPVQVVLTDSVANAWDLHALSLGHEAFIGSFAIGKPVPDISSERTTMLPASEAEAREAVVEKEGSFRIPRDMTGADFIGAMRRMNRMYLQEKGISGNDLERQSDPNIRQKGSHATIYCAQTDWIAPVPVHASALPIGTLRNVLRILQLDPAEFIKALE